MLKNISNLGKALNKAEQKEVNGGRRPSIIADHDAFSCFCGFVGSEGIDQTRFIVYADNIIGALNIAGPSCGGWGATCSGL